jgi:hypothetical protein
MAQLIEHQVYNLDEVIEMFGINKSVIDKMKLSGDFSQFPFTVMKIGDSMYVCPKNQVDRFIKTGKKPTNRNKPIGSGKERIWEKGEYVTWHLPMPKELDAAFETIWHNMNKELYVKMTKRQLIYIAVKEFIDRRPQFMVEETQKEEMD